MTWCVPAKEPDAILQHVASWGDRCPHRTQGPPLSSFVSCLSKTKDSEASQKAPSKLLLRETQKGGFSENGRDRRRPLSTRCRRPRLRGTARLRHCRHLLLVCRAHLRDASTEMPTMPSCAAPRNRRGSVQLLFDHLVGAGKQRRRDVEPKGSRRRKIDDELEFGRLLDR